MTQHWIKMHMKYDSAIKSVLPWLNEEQHFTHVRQAAPL